MTLEVLSWSPYIRGYRSYLKLERSLSKNTVESYTADVTKLAKFLVEESDTLPNKVKHDDLTQFIRMLNDIGFNARSQARVISGIKGFFKYMLIENAIDNDPSELLEVPKIGRRLPVTLSVEEVESIIHSVDLSKASGARDRAILETLYSCGLRVSEVVNMLISNIYFNDGFIRVVGKGDKDRLVPIGQSALKHLKIYITEVRNHAHIAQGFDDAVFLNKLGKNLSRVSIFKIVKKACLDAGIQKTVSPHTLRHSFATHLVEKGIPLHVVQDLLGHNSIKTTEIYLHISNKFRKELKSPLDELDI
jgi:integrase/recombinase XerD